MIPLHSGSSVYVAKDELIKAFDMKPAIYACQLAKLIFGKDFLPKKTVQFGEELSHLDPKKMMALISEFESHFFNSKQIIDLKLFISAHIMQIFQSRQVIISEDMIRTHLRKHIQTQINGNDIVKRVSLRKK